MLEFGGAIGFVQINRKVILDTIVVIIAHCVGEGQNADGGEILVGNDIWIKYSIQHPDTLTGNNTTSLGDTKLNETFVSPAT